jgi:hypothetical protein
VIAETRRTNGATLNYINNRSPMGLSLRDTRVGE